MQYFCIFPNCTKKKTLFNVMTLEWRMNNEKHVGKSHWTEIPYIRFRMSQRVLSRLYLAQLKFHTYDNMIKLLVSINIRCVAGHFSELYGLLLLFSIHVGDRYLLRLRLYSCQACLNSSLFETCHKLPTPTLFKIMHQLVGVSVGFIDELIVSIHLCRGVTIKTKLYLRPVHVKYSLQRNKIYFIIIHSGIDVFRHH